MGLTTSILNGQGKTCLLIVSYNLFYHFEGEALLDSDDDADILALNPASDTTTGE